jgi:hypothetical protein
VRRRQVREQRGELSPPLGVRGQGAALPVLVEIQPPGGQVLAQRGEGGLPLAVPDPDVRPGQVASVICRSTVPEVTVLPGAAESPLTTPALGAVTGFSIFIASSTSSRSPAATS